MTIEQLQKNLEAITGHKAKRQKLSGSMKGYYRFNFDFRGEFPLEDVKAILPYKGKKQNFYEVNSDISYKNIDIHESSFMEPITINPPGVKIAYECFYTHTKTVIDLGQDRWNCADQLATAYCQKESKRKTESLIQNFATGSSLYHTVRDLIEDIKTTDFDEILSTFKGLYPLMHKDWQSALLCGLSVKARSTEGGYINKPYIYTDNFTATLIQDINGDLGRMYPIINEILEDETIQPAEVAGLINTIDPVTASMPY